MTDDSSDAGHAARVLKRDALGRVQTRAAQRQSVLDEFGRSGLSGVKFAAVAGIKYATFASWVQRRKRERGSAGRKGAESRAGTGGAVALPALGWVQAEVERRPIAAEPKAVLRLQLPGGAVMEVGSQAQSMLAAGLLRALQASAGGVAC
jgi:hypothetical protein